MGAVEQDSGRRTRRRTLQDAEGAELLTVGQAAQVAQVAPGTVRKWFRQGLKRYGRGRVWRVRREELLAFLAQEDAQPAPDTEARSAALRRQAGLS
jgi:excisionase family DNA binding protein